MQPEANDTDRARTHRRGAFLVAISALAATSSACGAPARSSFDDGAKAARDSGAPPRPMDDAGNAGMDGGASTSDASAETGGCPVNPCREGASCVASACVYTDCIGVHVPGDYATPQQAADALATTGGTICLGAQSYEGIAVNTQKTIAVQGISSKHTILEGHVGATTLGSVIFRGLDIEGTASVTNVGGTVTFANCALNAPPGSRGLDLDNLSPGGATTVNVVASSISSTTSDAVYVFVNGSQSQQTATIVLDGVDISAGTGAAVRLLGAWDGTAPTASFVGVSVTLKNTYLHDSTDGIAYANTYTNALSELDDTLVVTNDTFVNVGTAIDVASKLPGVKVAYYNNLIVGNSVGVSVADDSVPSTTTPCGNNLLFGNTTNYGGIALDGPGDVKSDPLLDTSVTPPAPRSGSPAFAAGDAAHAPAVDYWGKARGTRVTIGAVQ